MLTDRTIQSEIKKAAKEKLLNDGAGGKGNGSLRLRIRPAATGTTATWIGTWQAQGRLRSKQLGKYPGLSLDAARKRFQAEVRDILHGGKNPKAMATATEAPTVERLFKGYIAAMQANGRSSWNDVEWALLTGRHAAVKAIGPDRLASDIEPGDISNLLGSIYRRGSRVVADRTRSYLLAAFNWGMKATNDYTAENRQDWGIKANPVAAVKKDTDAASARERNLSAAEIKVLWGALYSHGFTPDIADAIRLLICCGQRVKETLRVDGREVDLDAATWTMPADKTKVGRFPHTIPLPKQAVEVFRQLKSRHGDGPLFPARHGSAELLGHASVNRAITRWANAYEAENFQSRDLRRTWKSRAGEAGVDRFTRDLIQQHARSGDTGSRHYDMTDYFPQMRAAMDVWEKWLAAAIK